MGVAVLEDRDLIYATVKIVRGTQMSPVLILNKVQSILSALIEDYDPHILVVETHNPHIKRLVPVVLLKEIDGQVIRLNCTGKQFEKIERLEKIVAHPTGGYISHLVLERDQAWS